MTEGTITSAVRANYLQGKVAVVTGGCGGIGRAICDRFAREGAFVYASDVAPADGLAGGIRYLKHDVSAESDASAVMRQVENDHNRLDILVNAAGIEIEKTIEETTLDEWNRIFAINVTGTFLTSKFGLPLMRKAGPVPSSISAPMTDSSLTPLSPPTARQRVRSTP